MAHHESARHLPAFHPRRPCRCSNAVVEHVHSNPSEAQRPAASLPCLPASQCNRCPSKPPKVRLEQRPNCRIKPTVNQNCRPPLGYRRIPLVLFCRVFLSCVPPVTRFIADGRSSSQEMEVCLVHVMCYACVHRLCTRGVHPLHSSCAGAALVAGNTLWGKSVGKSVGGHTCTGTYTFGAQK